MPTAITQEVRYQTIDGLRIRYADSGGPDEPVVAVPIQLGERLTSWVFDPDPGKYRRMDPRTTVAATLDKIGGGVPDEIRADYLDSYDGDRFAESMG